MYVLFCNMAAKSFVIRNLAVPDAHTPPDGDVSWVDVGTAFSYFVAAIAAAKWRADEHGWRNWDVMIEDAP